MVTIEKHIGSDLKAGYYDKPTEHLWISSSEGTIYLWPEEFQDLMSFIETLPRPNGFFKEEESEDEEDNKTQA
jgi:hypothetical protein